MFVCAWLASVAFAAAPVTIEEVERAAVAANPALQRARAESDAARGRLVAARGVFDPVLGVDPTWSRTSSKGFLQGFPTESKNTAWGLGADLGGRTSFGTTYGVAVGLDRQLGRYVTDFGAGETESTQDTYAANLGASLRQPLLEGFGTAYTTRFVRQATSAADRASLAADAEQQSTLADAAKVYWAWAYAVEALRIAVDAESTAKEALRIGGLREDAGTIAPIELVRLQASEVQARTNRVEAEHAVVRARHAVELVMGSPLADGAVPASSPDAPPPVVDEAVAVSAALVNNPDLLVLRALRDEASATVGDARHTLRPQLDATGAAGVSTREDTAGGALGGLASDPFPYVQAGAELAVPLGNRAARGTVDAAQAELHAAEVQLAGSEASVRAAVEEAVLAVQSAAQKVELADAQERLQKALVDAEEAKIAAGGSIEQQLLEVRTAYAAARAEAFRTRTDLRVAEVELARLQGALAAP